VLIEPLDDIPHHMTRDNLRDRPREDVEEAARKWFGIAKEMKEVQDVLAEDLERVLHLLQDYQRIVAMLQSPDPHTDEVKELFRKYKMRWTENTSKNYGVYLDGKDITETHKEGDEALVERVELVRDEGTGKIFFRPVEHKHIPVPEWSQGDVIEAEENLTPKSRDWLDE
jgi:hypothetical protein